MYENENSNMVPLLDKLALLADYYNCSLDYLVFNKESVYKGSFKKKDILSRIADLIFSLSLIPVKETNPKNSHYGKYYFCSYDEDISIYLDKLEVKSREKNYLFKYKAINDLAMLEHFYKTIDEMPYLEEDFSPSFGRINQVVQEGGNDPLEYYLKNIANIERCRTVDALKKVK